MGRPLLAHSCPSIGRLASIRPTGSRWAIPDPKRSFVRARKSRLLPIRFQGRAAAAQWCIEYDSGLEDGGRFYPSLHFRTRPAVADARAMKDALRVRPGFVDELRKFIRRRP
jgi:hypothetical protein